MNGRLPLQDLVTLPIPDRGQLAFALRYMVECALAGPHRIMDGQTAIDANGDRWHLRAVGGSGDVRILVFGPNDAWIFSVANADTGQMTVEPLRPAPGAQCHVTRGDALIASVEGLQSGAPIQRQWPARPRKFRFAVSATLDFVRSYDVTKVATENVMLASALVERYANVMLCPVIDERAIDRTGTIYGQTGAMDDTAKRAKAHETFKRMDLQFDLGQVFDLVGDSWGEPAGLCTPQFAGHGITNWTDGLSPQNVWLLTHEVSHQLGATHTFNGNYAGREQLTAVEPGDGRSLLGYPPSPTLAWFHPISIAQILINTEKAATTYNSCGSPFGIWGGSAPVLFDSTGEVPMRTPIALGGSTMPDSIAYAMGEVTEAGYAGSAPPWFASRSEASRPGFTFPLLESLLMPRLPGDDILPAHATLPHRPLRVLEMQRTREGSIGFALHTIAVRNTGPLEIPAQQGWKADATVTLTWFPGGTDLPPLSATTLHLDISVDGVKWRRLKTVNNTGHDPAVVLEAVDHGHAVRVRLSSTTGRQPFFAVSPPFTVQR